MCVPETETVGLPLCVADTVPEGEWETEGEPDTEPVRDTVPQPLAVKLGVTLVLTVVQPLAVMLGLLVEDTVEEVDTL